MAPRSSFALLLALCLCATSALAVPVASPQVPALPSISNAIPSPNDFTVDHSVPKSARAFSPDLPIKGPDTDAAVAANPFKPTARDLAERKHDRVTGVYLPLGSGIEDHKYSDSKRSPVDDTVANAATPLGYGLTYHKHVEGSSAPPKRDGLSEPIKVEYKHHNKRAHDGTLSLPSERGLGLDDLVRRQDGSPPPPPPKPATSFDIPKFDLDIANVQLRSLDRRQDPPSPKTQLSIPGSGAGLDVAKIHSRRQGPPGPSPPPPPPETSIELPQHSTLDTAHLNIRRHGDVNLPSGGSFDGASLYTKREAGVQDVAGQA